jgi:hypothetical protein
MIITIILYLISNINKYTHRRLRCWLCGTRSECKSDDDEIDGLQFIYIKRI